MTLLSFKPSRDASFSNKNKTPGNPPLPHLHSAIDHNHNHNLLAITLRPTLLAIEAQSERLLYNCLFQRVSLLLTLPYPPPNVLRARPYSPTLAAEVIDFRKLHGEIIPKLLEDSSHERAISQPTNQKAANGRRSGRESMNACIYLCTK